MNSKSETCFSISAREAQVDECQYYSLCSFLYIFYIIIVVTRMVLYFKWRSLFEFNLNDKDCNLNWSRCRIVLYIRLEVFGYTIPASDILAGSVFNFDLKFAFRPLHFGEVLFTAQVRVHVFLAMSLRPLVTQSNRVHFKLCT